MSVDLMLVNPGGRRKIYQHLSNDLTAIEPPIWAGLIADYVRRKGYSVTILDANAEELTPSEVADIVAEENPTLVGIVIYGHNPSASTTVMPSAREIVQTLKEKTPDEPIVLVGGHVAALPHRTMKEEKADFVCDGEGPITVVELLQALKSSNPDFRKVRGLLFREGDQIIQTEPAPLVTDLDAEMKGIPWDLLPVEKYRAHNWHCFENIAERQPYAALYTSLGCPFRCDFCCIQAPFKRGELALGYPKKVNSYRMWNASSVIEQIEFWVEKVGVRNIKIADEIFVLNKKHVVSICEEVIKRRYDLNMWCYARVDIANDDKLLDLMASAGFRWVCLGIETGNERVRSDVKKRFSQEAIFEGVRKFRSAGFNIIANYLFGLPEDDFDSMNDTLNLAFELNCEFANFYCAMAYPGSELFSRATSENWPLPDSWSGYAQHSFDTFPLPTKYLSNREVLEFRDKAFNEYFLREEYLNMVKNKFGDDVVKHIKLMTATKLRRKLLVQDDQRG